jgi:hypothetical protein
MVGGDLSFASGLYGESALQRVLPDFSPAAAVDVSLELRPAESTAAPLRTMDVKTDADGEARFELAGLDAGAYHLLGNTTIDGRAAAEQATFVVRPEGRELDDIVARAAVLRELASASGGQFRSGSLGTPEVRPPPQSARRQPAHHRDLVAPALARAGSRAAGRGVDEAQGHRTSVGREFRQGRLPPAGARVPGPRAAHAKPRARGKGTRTLKNPLRFA